MKELDFEKRGPLHEAMIKIANDIQAKKTEIILGRLKELGIDFDIEYEDKMLFKSIMCVNGNHHLYPSETYYYNDSSPDGLRIVTFTTKAPKDFTSKSDMSYLLNYY